MFFFFLIFSFLPFLLNFCSDFFNHSAGDFCAAVACRLSGEIVGVLVDYHRFAQNFGQRNAFCEKKRKRLTIKGEKWWHIAGVARVRLVLRIEMSARLRKIVLATAALMDVICKNVALRLWQALHIREHHHAGWQRIKLRHSANVRKLLPAKNLRHRVWTAV